MRILAALVLLAVLAGCATRGVPAANGIRNFGKVNDSLYRGAQPDKNGIQQLRAMGIQSVVNLRMTKEVWQEEPEVAAASSMTYTNIPLEPRSAPLDAQVAGVLAAISSMPKPIFIHCKYGCDRTGTIIACYRIQQDRWANSSALKEAETYGISLFEVGMRNYIKQFMRQPWIQEEDGDPP